MRAAVSLLPLLLVACNRDYPLPGPGADLAAPPLPLADLAVSSPVPDLGQRFPRTEIRFTPGAADLQIAVWIEDKAGHVVETLLVTSATGQFGIGNRPGDGLLKTDFKWPYGRREMVLPVWAHRRNHHYPKIVMGGSCAGARVLAPTQLCGDGRACGGDCDDATIAYHSRVSSYEPYFCSPSGASRIDAMSCASKGTFCKGCFDDSPAFSLYPPRADIQKLDPMVDCPDVAQFAQLNDLVAVSAATPLRGKSMAPIAWFPGNVQAGDYVAWVELSQESDFNASHNHPNHADTVQAWDFEGHSFLGQPSVLYAVPFNTGAPGHYITAKYAGYSTWDGSDGVLHPPDNTISDSPGTGAGRLLEANGARVLVDVY